jgi:hypothetical protein
VSDSRLYSAKSLVSFANDAKTGPNWKTKFDLVKNGWLVGFQERDNRSVSGFFSRWVLLRVLLPSHVQTMYLPSCLVEPNGIPKQKIKPKPRFLSIPILILILISVLGGRSSSIWHHLFSVGPKAPKKMNFFFYDFIHFYVPHTFCSWQNDSLRCPCHI